MGNNQVFYCCTSQPKEQHTENYDKENTPITQKKLSNEVLNNVLKNGASNLKTVVKIQGVIRGFLYRRTIKKLKERNQSINHSNRDDR